QKPSTVETSAQRQVAVDISDLGMLDGVARIFGGIKKTHVRLAVPGPALIPLIDAVRKCRDVVLNEVPKIPGIQKIEPVVGQSSRDIPYGGCTTLPRDILLLRIGQPRGHLIYRRAVGKIRVELRNTVDRSAVDVESGSIPNVRRRLHDADT